MMVGTRLLVSREPRRIRERRARFAANRSNAIGTGEFFENEVWLLLDRMGFEELNPHGFKLDATPEGYARQTKQIDVLAKWQKEVLVIECKASDQDKVGLDRTDLSDLHEKQPRLTRSIYDEGGRDVRVSYVVWLKGITPGRRDVEDAARYKLVLLDYDDLLAYRENARLVGAASKFQLLARVYGPRKESLSGFRKAPAMSGKVGGKRYAASVPRPRPNARPDLDAVFAAVAHPIRRAILERLSAGDATVTELAEPHRVSLPAISRHLRVLEQAGLIEVAPEGRVHRVQIDAAPLSAAFGWLTRYRVLWEDRFDRLAEHVERPKKSKSRK